MAWPAGLCALLGFPCLQEARDPAASLHPELPSSPVSVVDPCLGMSAPEGRVFAHLEPGPAQEYRGGEHPEMAGAEAGEESLKWQEGGEDPWGKSSLKESPRTGGRYPAPCKCRAQTLVERRQKGAVIN